MVIIRGVRQVPELRVPSAPSRPGIVRLALRRGDPYWKEQGWTQTATHFEGFYQAQGRRFKGAVDSEAEHFLIFRPPEALKRHSHWPCFRYKEHGWYEVHFM